MTQKRRSGKAWKESGIALIACGVAISLVLRFVPASETNEVLAAIGFLPLFLIPAGAFLYWRGRQYAAQADAERIISDTNPDVLYLRTFRSDPSTVNYLWSSLLTPVLFSGLATEEEQLAEVLRPVGDLVAIGQPGEALPKPGAARIYASEAEWKEVVERQMQTARLVIIRAGVGDNLLWELKRAVELLDPKKVLLLVLNMKLKHYESFRARAESTLSVPLPDGKTLKRFGRLWGFISFAEDWKPRFLPMRAPYLRRSVFKPYRRLFKFALRPVFESFGCEWQPPPISVATVTASSVLILVALLILVAIAVS